MKKVYYNLLLIIVCVGMCILCVWAINKKHENAVDIKHTKFKVVEQYDDCVVIVDTDSGIGYAQLYGSKELVTLYNPDETLYRPNGWRDYAE